MTFALFAPNVNLELLLRARLLRGSQRSAFVAVPLGPVACVSQTILPSSCFSSLPCGRVSPGM